MPTHRKRGVRNDGSEVLPTLLPEIHEAVLVGAFLPEGFFTTPDLE